MSWITVSLPDGSGVYETWEGSILEKEENMKRGEILDSVKRTITQDRNNRHGEPENSFPQIADAWHKYLQQRDPKNPLLEIRPSDVAEMMALFKDVRFHMQPENPDNKHDQIGYLAIAAELRATEMTATGNSAPSSMPVGYLPKSQKKPVLMTLLGYPITQIINSTGDAFPEGCEQDEYLAVKKGDTDYLIYKFMKKYDVWQYITECYVPGPVKKSAAIGEQVKSKIIMTLCGYPVSYIVENPNTFPSGNDGEYLAEKIGDDGFEIHSWNEKEKRWQYKQAYHTKLEIPPASRIYSNHLRSCLVSQTKDGKFEPLFPKEFRSNPSYNCFPKDAHDGDMIAADILMGPGTSNLQAKFFRYVSDGDEWVEITDQPAAT